MWTKIKFLVVALFVVSTLTLAARIPVSASPLSVEPGEALTGTGGVVWEPLPLPTPIKGGGIIWKPFPLPTPTPFPLPIIITIPSSVVASCGADGNTMGCLQNFCDAQRAGEVQATEAGYVCVSNSH